MTIPPIADPGMQILDALLKENSAGEILKLGARKELLGMSPVFVVAAMGHLEGMQRFIDVDADVVTCRYNGTTPLLIATKNKQVAMLTLLLKNGANIADTTPEGENVFMVAVQTGDAKVLNAVWPYRNRLDINHTNENGEAALHYAADKMWEGCVAFLVNNGVSPNIQDTRGRTPLMIAAARGDMKTADKLLTAGADVLREDQCGQTAICFSVNDETRRFILDKMSERERDLFIKGRVERMRKSLINIDDETGYHEVVFPLFQNLILLEYCRGAIYKYKLIPNILTVIPRFLTKHLLVSEACHVFSLAICHYVTLIEERFALQFIRSRGPEFCLKASKLYSGNPKVDTDSAVECFMPIVCIAGIASGKEWLERNRVMVAPLAEKFKSKISSYAFGDEGIKHKCKLMWKHFLDYFETVQCQQSEQKLKELLEEEERERVKQIKKRERRRKKRQRQQESKDVGSGDMDEKECEQHNAIQDCVNPETAITQQNRFDNKPVPSSSEDNLNETKNLIQKKSNYSQSDTAVEPDTYSNTNVRSKLLVAERDSTDDRAQCLPESRNDMDIPLHSKGVIAKKANPRYSNEVTTSGANESCHHIVTMMETEVSYNSAELYKVRIGVENTAGDQWVTVQSKKLHKRIVETDVSQNCKTKKSRNNKNKTQKKGSDNDPAVSASQSSMRWADVAKRENIQPLVEKLEEEPGPNFIQSNYDEEFPSLSNTNKHAPNSSVEIKPGLNRQLLNPSCVEVKCSDDDQSSCTDSHSCVWGSESDVSRFSSTSHIQENDTISVQDNFEDINTAADPPSADYNIGFGIKSFSNVLKPSMDIADLRVSKMATTSFPADVLSNNREETMPNPIPGWTQRNSYTEETVIANTVEQSSKFVQANFWNNIATNGIKKNTSGVLAPPGFAMMQHFGSNENDKKDKKTPDFENLDQYSLYNNGSNLYLKQHQLEESVQCEWGSSKHVLGLHYVQPTREEKRLYDLSPTVDRSNTKYQTTDEQVTCLPTFDRLKQPTVKMLNIQLQDRSCMATNNDNQQAQFQSIQPIYQDASKTAFASSTNVSFDRNFVSIDCRSPISMSPSSNESELLRYWTSNAPPASFEQTHERSIMPLAISDSLVERPVTSCMPEKTKSCYIQQDRPNCANPLHILSPSPVTTGMHDIRTSVSLGIGRSLLMNTARYLDKPNDEVCADDVLYPSDLRSPRRENNSTTGNELIFPGFHDTVVLAKEDKKQTSLETIDLIRLSQLQSYYKSFSENSLLKDTAYFHDFYYYASSLGLDYSTIFKYAGDKCLLDEKPTAHSSLSTDKYDFMDTCRSSSKCSFIRSCAYGELNNVSQDAILKKECFQTTEMNRPHVIANTITDSDVVNVYDIHEEVISNSDITNPINNTNLPVGNVYSETVKAEIKPRSNAPDKHIDEKPWEPSSRRWKDKLREIREMPANMTIQIGNIIIPQKYADRYIITNSSEPVVLGFLEDGSEVAVRVIDRDTAAANVTHMQRLVESGMMHYFLIKYRAFAVRDNNCFLAMDLYEYTLAEYIKILRLDHRYDPLCVNKLAWQMLKGLAALHEQFSMAHGNLTPFNLVVDLHGKLLLTQYGFEYFDDRMSSTAATCSFHDDRRCWEACEILTGDENKSSFSDIQVSGMLIHYILTGGKHPFGENTYEIQINLCSGWIQPVYISEEANELLSAMLAPSLADRPTATSAQRHPYFWSDEKRLRFILIVGSDVLRDMKAGYLFDNCTMIYQLNEIVCDPLLIEWMSEIDNLVMKDMRSFRQYKSCLSDLVLFVFNCCLHFEKLSSGARAMLGDPCNYFLSKFPTLFMSVYRAVRLSDKTTKCCYKPFF